jgi:hypothetical protein
MKKLSLKNAKRMLSRKEMKAINGGGYGGSGDCTNQCNDDSDCSCIQNCHGYSTGSGSQHCATLMCDTANTVQKRCSC